MTLRQSCFLLPSIACLAEHLPERALEVEQVLATRSGADGCAEVLVKWEVPPWRNPNPNPDP